MSETVNDLMERASGALGSMAYGECERLCLEALGVVREAEDWDSYARILLPLQEARRQRRMIAAEGYIRLGTGDLEGPADDWLNTFTAGCVVVTRPFTHEHAAALAVAVAKQHHPIEVLFADNEVGAEQWRVCGLMGKVSVMCDAPALSWTNRWLEPGEGEPEGVVPGAADWFMNAAEALGDAALKQVTTPEGSLQRIEQLEQMMRGVRDHEILHQELGTAARAMQTPDSHRTRPKKKRKRRVLGVILLMLIAVLTLSGGITYHLFNSEPAGWTEARHYLSHTTAAQRAEVGHALINRLATQTSFADLVDEFGRLPADHPKMRTIKLSTDQINAWLDQHLDLWLKNQNVTWPAQLGRPVFWTQRPRAMIGMRVRSKNLNQVVSVAFVFDFPEDQKGDARVQIDGVWLGKLRVPLGIALDPISEYLIARDRQADAARLDHLVKGLSFPPVQEINHQPYNRWLDIRPVEDGLEIVLKKE